MQQEHRQPPVLDRHADLQEGTVHVPGIMAFPAQVTMTIERGVPMLHLSGEQRDILSAERWREEVSQYVTLHSNVGLRVLTGLWPVCPRVSQAEMREDEVEVVTLPGVLKI